MSWLSRLIYGKPKPEREFDDVSLLSTTELVRLLEKEKLILVDGVGIDLHDTSDGKIVYSFPRDMVDPAAPPEVQKEFLKQVRQLVDRMYESALTRGLYETYEPDDDGTIEINDSTRKPLKAPFIEHLAKLGEFHFAHNNDFFADNIGDMEPDEDFEALLGLEWYVNDIITKLRDDHFMAIPYEPEEEWALERRAKEAVKKIPRDMLEIIFYNKIPLRYLAEQSAVSSGGRQAAGAFHDETNFIYFCEQTGGQFLESHKDLKGVDLIRHNEAQGFKGHMFTAVHEVGHAIFNRNQAENICKGLISKNDYKKLWAGVEKLRERVARIEAGDATLLEEALPIIKSHTEEQKSGFIPWLQSIIKKYGDIGTKGYDEHRKNYEERLAVEYLVDWFVLMQDEHLKGSLYRPYAEFICPEMCQLVDSLITQKAEQDLPRIRERLSSGKSEELLFGESKRDRVRELVLKLTTPNILGRTEEVKDREKPYEGR